MQNDYQISKNVKQILFLGLKSSGKSTLFRQMLRTQGEVFDDKTKKKIGILIQYNCVMAILTLVKQTQLLCSTDHVLYADCHLNLDISSEAMDAAYMTDEKREKRRILVKKIKFLTKHQHLATMQILNKTMQKLGEFIWDIWNESAVQNTFHKRVGIFTFPDNIDSFFNRLQSNPEIFCHEYMPEDDGLFFVCLHILYLRILI